MSDSPLVALLILTWNRRDDVLRCVASLPRLDYPNLLPVVIDNASSDGTVAALRRQHPALEIIENGRNLGYAGGNNVGIRWALERGADYVLIANSDTEMTAGLVSELVRVAESDPRIAVVGCRNLLMEDPRLLWGAYAELTYGPFVVRTAGERVADGEGWRVVRDVDSVIGNGYLWRRAALEQVGLLDERFFGYHEDVDWCLRARRAGRRVVYAGTAAIIHKGGSSSDRRQARSFPMSYFLGRNGVLFARKHGSRLEKLRFAVLCSSALGFRWARALLLATRGERGRDFVAMERGFTKGLWDALRERPVPFGELGLDDAV
jgi:GT2 family glycosyltransferase